MTHLSIRFHNGVPQKASENEVALLKKVQDNIAQNAYGFFEILGDEEVISEVEKTAEDLKKSFKHFVVLGTGGSSLGAKTLCDLKTNSFADQSHKVYFLNNVDSHTIEQALGGLDMEQTCFIAVSKSGTTAETLCQTLCIIKHLEAAKIEVKKHFVILTEPKESAITKLAQSYGIAPLAHSQKIGGRFSVFSNVGLLPAALVGVDIRALHQGAKAYVANFQSATSNHPAFEGALFAQQNMAAGKRLSVMMPYVDRLASFAQWYVQLWAESLGKQGKGSTPIAALGTVDQHSQLQLYSDGPDDKTYTFVMQNSQDSGLTPSDYVSQDDRLSYLKNQTMGDLLYAEARATIDSLVDVKRPVRVMSFAHLDEKVLGELLAHFMLETIVTAEFLEINAFDQPGVEQSKVLTRHYLAKKKAS